MHQCITHQEFLINGIFTWLNVIILISVIVILFKTRKLNKETKQIQEECFRVITGIEREKNE